MSIIACLHGDCERSKRVRASLAGHLWWAPPGGPAGCVGSPGARAGPDDSGALCGPRAPAVQRPEERSG